MTSFAAESLQNALYVTLKADSALMANLSGIFDHVPEGSMLPYITLGEGSLRDWSSKTHQGQEHLFDVHLWSEKVGGKEIREMADQVNSLLDNAALTLSGHQLVTLRFVFFENFFDAEGRVRHGIMRFRARTLSTN